MSKSNDTTKTRELTEAELAAVSGGIKDFAGTYVPFAGDGLGASHSIMGGYKTAASEGWGNYKTAQAEGYGN
jgi:bacteriocin-like protein